MRNQTKIDSQTLRQLAGEIVADLADQFDLSDSEEAELVTSLVRQWAHARIARHSS